MDSKGIKEKTGNSLIRFRHVDCVATDNNGNKNYGVSISHESKPHADRFSVIVKSGSVL